MRLRKARSHTDYTDWLAPDGGPSTLGVLESVGLEHLDRRLQVTEAHPDLHVFGERRRRAEFLNERVRQVLVPFCVSRKNAPQQIDPPCLSRIEKSQFLTDRNVTRRWAGRTIRH
jgi:hypothetical protein